MSKTLTLELADTLYKLLVEASNQRGQHPEQVIVEWLEERLRPTPEASLPQSANVIDTRSTGVADYPQITPDFAQQVADFIEEYRPALEALAK